MYDEFAASASWVMLLTPGKFVRTGSGLFPHATQRFGTAAAGTAAPLASVADTGMPNVFCTKLLQSPGAIGVPAAYGLFAAATGTSWFPLFCSVRCVPL